MPVFRLQYFFASESVKAIPEIFREMKPIPFAKSISVARPILFVLSALSLFILCLFTDKAPVSALPGTGYSIETQPVNDPFERGLAIRDSLGNEDVIAFWEKTYFEMLEEGLHDPRIGFHFMEYVVGNRDAERYSLATDIYFWGLRSSFEETFAEEVHKEIRLMEPLIGRRDFREWEQLFQNRDTRLFQEIRDFWIRNNMVPSSDRNERLIEHWHRIHYAREYFTNDTNTVYGADERALVYVRLGPPDRERSGTLSYNTAEIRNRLYDLVEAGAIRHGQIYNLQMNIIQNFSPGRYDFWKYERISPDGPVIYLFGRPGRAGRYRLMDSLDDFISGSGYRSVVLGTRGSRSAMRAGYFLQMMLYNEMSTLDHYFGDKLLDYERNWNQAIFLNKVDGRMLGDMLSPQLAARDMKQIQDRAPQAKSMYERNLINFEMTYRQYRFLDDELGPVVWVYMSPGSQLQRSIHMLEKQAGFNDEAYLLRQGFHQYREGQLIDTQIEEHRAVFLANASDAPGYITTGLFPVNDAKDEILAFSELYFHETSQFANLFRNNLIGLSRLWTAAETTDGDAGQLFVSDLVPGSTAGSKVPVRSTVIGILEEDIISVSEDLQIYFEIYNIKPDAEGEYRYRISYRLVPEQRRRFFRRRSRDVSLSWDAASQGPNDHQFFEVSLTHAETGKYTLEITVEIEETDEKDRKSVV